METDDIDRVGYMRVCHYDRGSVSNWLFYTKHEDGNVTKLDEILHVVVDGCPLEIDLENHRTSPNQRADVQCHNCLSSIVEK